MGVKKLEDKIKILETRLEEVEGKIFDLKVFYAMDISIVRSMIMTLWYHYYLPEFRKNPEGMKQYVDSLEEVVRREYKNICKVLEIKDDLWEETREVLIENMKRKFNESVKMYPELFGKFKPPEA